MSGRAIKRVYKDTRMAGYLFYLQVAYKLFQHNKNGTNLTYLRHFPLPVGNFLKRNYNQKHLKYLKHFFQSKMRLARFLLTILVSLCTIFFLSSPAQASDAPAKRIDAGNASSVYIDSAGKLWASRDTFYYEGEKIAQP